jgi:hypothetical protein
MGQNCTETTQVPPQEHRWRSIVSTIKRSTKGPAANMNYIAHEDGWFKREEYERQVIVNYLFSQRKGQGSST